MFPLHGRRCFPWKQRQQSGGVLAPEGAESDKHLFPESCLQNDWTDGYAKSEAFESE